MTHIRSVAVALIVVAAAAYLALGAVVTPNDVYHALDKIPLTHRSEIVHAFGVGFSLGRLVPDRTLQLVNRLAADKGTTADKEGILLTIAHALEDDLPVTLLIDKTEEGLARNVPLYVILNGSGGTVRILGLVQREKALVAVRDDLLYAKGIFCISRTGQATATSLPRTRFDRIVTEVADVICDYVESGASPLDGHLIYQQVQTRLENLSQLRQPVILPEDAALVLARIKPADLTEVTKKVYGFINKS